MITVYPDVPNKQWVVKHEDGSEQRGPDIDKLLELTTRPYYGDERSIHLQELRLAFNQALETHGIGI